MNNRTLDEVMKNVPILKFEDLKIGDEFIVAPLLGEEVDPKRPFHVFKKVKRTYGIHGQHNAKRRIDDVLSHIPPDMSVILLKEVPEDVIMK